MLSDLLGFGLKSLLQGAGILSGKTIPRILPFVLDKTLKNSKLKYKYISVTWFGTY